MLAHDRGILGCCWISPYTQSMGRAANKGLLATAQPRARTTAQGLAIEGENLCEAFVDLLDDGQLERRYESRLRQSASSQRIEQKWACSTGDAVTVAFTGTDDIYLNVKTQELEKLGTSIFDSQEETLANTRPTAPLFFWQKDA